jgi:galactokinase
VKYLTEEWVKSLFLSRFSSAADIVVKAPGRVNLIGEHTDYNGGFVLPAAINFYTYIAASPNHQKLQNQKILQVVAEDFNQQISIDLTQPFIHDDKNSWPNYVYGVIQQLQKAGFQLNGGNLLITGNVPAGAGLSSSAALEMALVRALLGLSGETIDPVKAALLGQAAENQFVGCNCGIMDQLISALGQESSALLIDCENLSTNAISIPKTWEILIVHSGVKRGLVDSEYNQRRRQCETAAAFFRKTSLRHVELPQLLAAETQLDSLSFRRARHVITENQRTLLAADALEKGDMPTLARVMAESHQSMRDDFNITTPAIDKLVEIIQVAGKGNAGARMTGGGFGGCVVAIADAGLIPELIAAVESQYQQQTGCVPTIILAKASAGAF